ncbi:hypothetical protein AX766_01110 [Flavobacterium covae]|uniref:DUF6029 family protein n=1 Tax=Flavobacterium covae TaxID=2906076 RepID=A0ABW8PJB1_9FLAO|nr:MULTISPECIES: DUF6029 family protein [Flavobacterium]AND63118.1 hypothetical protein AX766_01110 [Flavobacterium covae]OWP81470.1 hypothetical protein BWK63_05755 [Flavobacterium covae]POR23111.1 hypothetical protein BWK57_03445 [Flavobacterium columnare]
MCKKIISFFCLFISTILFSQENQTGETSKRDYGKVFGFFESNGQWYLNDKELKVDQPDDPIRSNNYLGLNYNYKRFTMGVQTESYVDKALLNFNPEYKKTNIGTYYLNYKSNKLDITAGYFYQQFGSGLILRAWEDRALGINNALRGGRVTYKPFDFISLTALYGKQRTGFEVANSDIYGFNTDIDITNLLKKDAFTLEIGFSYVGRNELTDVLRPNFLSLTNTYSGRLNFSKESFYISTEYDYKSPDAVVEFDQIENNFIKSGSALLINTGFSKKGFGIDATFRRLENMSFFSERKAKGNFYNDKIVNFVPSLTKQHHNSLSNIYVYQAQPNVSMPDETILKAGEIGGQIDIFYNVKKGTMLGGKYGAKIAFNTSNWFGLGGKFSFDSPRDYQTDFLSFGQKYFSDYNIEIDKKINENFFMNLIYVNQYYNKKQVEETYGLVKTNCIGLEGTYKFKNTNRSLRALGEHLWADSDKKNWYGGTLEFNFNQKISLYVADLYNYGNEEAEKRQHYYNFGGVFRKKSTRIQLAYGRQRGGLMCVGGVCRIVPESSGLSLNINTAF